MKLNEYQRLALRTAPSHTHGVEDLMHGCAGICTEGGELMDVFKKHHFYGKPVDWTNVKEEIGDVAWYLALLCRAAGTTLEDVCTINIAKLAARFPEKFSAEAAINRNLAVERAVLEGAPINA